MPRTDFQYRIKHPSEFLFGDEGMQLLIQQSSRLTYACLLIHRNRLELAAYLLDTFQHLRDPRILSLVLCLRVYLLTLQSRYPQAKNLAVRHLEQHPSDVTAISLLQYVILSELGMPVEKSVTGQVSSPPQTNQPISFVDAKPSSGGDNLYQSICDDPLTKLLITWDQSPNSLLITSKDPEYEYLGKILPALLPSAISRSCQLLDGGGIQKLEFNWEKLKVVSWHSGQGNLALVTSQDKQTRLTVTRAESIFRREFA